MERNYVHMNATLGSANLHPVVKFAPVSNLCTRTRLKMDYITEPPRGKTNNVVSEQVRHKPTCTSTEKSMKLEISDLRRRGIVLSE